MRVAGGNYVEFLALTVFDCHPLSINCFKLLGLFPFSVVINNSVIELPTSDVHSFVFFGESDL